MATLLSLSYAAGCLLIFLCQKSLIYVPHQGATDPATYGLSDVEVQRLSTPDGAALETWMSIGDPTQPVVVFFHGNAGNLANRVALLQLFDEAGYGFVAVDYRGYGNSTGEPGYETMIKDALLVVDHMRGSHRIGGRKVILYGESLGTGIATEVATMRSVDGLVLQSPYTSIAAAAASRMPWLPINLLLTETFSNIDHIGSTETPLLIIHGENDELFPVSMARQLYEAAKGVKVITTIPHAGHNDLHIEDIRSALEQFAANL